MALTAAAWAKSAFAVGLLALSIRRHIRWTLLSLITLVNMVAVAGIVTQWVRCRPIYKAWMVDVHGTCFERATSNAVAISVQGEFTRGPGEEEKMRRGRPWTIVHDTDQISYDSILRLRRHRPRYLWLLIGLVKGPYSRRDVRCWVSWASRTGVSTRFFSLWLPRFCSSWLTSIHSGLALQLYSRPSSCRL